ncbi:MAG: hypothetical protein LBI38_07110 [Oscillospiraceae bacterium]|jgi:hypothetical protein|nr:hypothetical protein [Oscillospiraceae bacterium]
MTAKEFFASADKTDVKKALRKVKNANYRQILVKRYLQRKKWEQIQKEIYSSRRNVFYWHKAALREFERKNRL